MKVTIKTNRKSVPESMGTMYPEYAFTVKAKDVPEGIPTEINPRSARRHGKGYFGMLKSLTTPKTGSEAPFATSNMGMKVAADGARFFTKNDAVYAELTMDEDNNGLFNGGHSYLGILDAQSSETFNGDELIHVSVTVGLSREQILDAATKSNTAKQLSSYSIANAEGYFDSLDGRLQQIGVRKNFKFEEGEEAKTKSTVLDVLRLLMVANPTLYPTNVARSKRKHGQTHYTSKNNTFKSFFKNEEAVNEFAARLPELFNVATFVLKQADAIYKKSYDRVFDTTAVVPFDRNVAVVDHHLYQGVLVPIVATFRLFVNDDMELKYDIGKILAVYKRALPELLDKAVQLINRSGGVDAAAGTELIWDKLYDIVEEHLPANRTTALSN
jgi:uncharacterized protein YlbG (UPF0298 family)